MRLLVGRCEVLYTGRLTARLPEAVRLLMFKADGSSSSMTMPADFVFEQDQVGFPTGFPRLT